MTQKSDVIDSFQKYKILTNADLFELLNIPKPSIRRLTGTLTKSGVLNRIGRGTYELIKDTNLFVFRHLISAGFSEKGFLEQLYAVSFKRDEIEIFNELKKALINFADGNRPLVEKGVLAQTAEDFHYSVDKVPYDEIDRMAIYPNIKTGID